VARLSPVVGVQILSLSDSVVPCCGDAVLNSVRLKLSLSWSGAVAPAGETAISSLVSLRVRSGGDMFSGKAIKRVVNVRPLTKISVAQSYPDPHLFGIQ
jgi:hypothetical protein